MQRAKSQVSTQRSFAPSATKNPPRIEKGYLKQATVVEKNGGLRNSEFRIKDSNLLTIRQSSEVQSSKFS